MARFSKDALLKWLHERYEEADDKRRRTSGRMLEFYDGKSVGLLEVLNAIERGEIGEGK